MRDQRLRDRVRAGPLRRTTPIPPRPGGVAIGDDGIGGGKHDQKTAERSRDAPGPAVRRYRSRYFRAEIMTVFENASPTLSVVAPGTSATAMCTMRRSYGFSGPSC